MKMYLKKMTNAFILLQVLRSIIIQYIYISKVYLKKKKKKLYEHSSSVISTCFPKTIRNETACIPTLQKQHIYNINYD